MKFKVDGVDDSTGRAVEPLILEADNEAAATSRARQRGLRPTSVKEFTPPPARPPRETVGRTQYRSAAPTLNVILGAIFWFIAGGSFYGDSLAAMITAAACGICGSIFFVGATITHCLDRVRRHE